MKAEIRELKAKYNVLAKQAGLQTGSLVESPPVTAPMRSASAGMAGRSLQASGAPLQVSHA